VINGKNYGNTEPNWGDIGPSNYPATWQKHREIRFRSAATILETFRLPKDGRYYKRLIAGFVRIFYSTFYFASDEHDAEAVVMTRTSFRFVKDLRLLVG
jgi:hypothetical protein